jgi:two-component system, OmpR family, sensor histidine kinase KdpD
MPRHGACTDPAASFYDIFTEALRYSSPMIKKPLWIGYLCAAGAAIVCTLIGLAMAPRFDVVNIAMVYLLAVVVIALTFSRGAAVLSAVLCVAAFDVMFVPPHGAFTVHDAQYLLTFTIMLAVALIISGLIERGRRQAEVRVGLSLEAETERIRSTLLASISHDLRTPLAVMTGASSSLAQGGERLPPEERAALAQSIYTQAREMSEQVTKILQMTRLETGAIKLERDWAAIPEIAASVLSRLSERLASHRLVVEIPADLPLVRADATLIDQALANLVENAARHTPAGTVVRIRAQHAADELVISVEDLGMGIDDRDVERVFAKFGRGTSEGPGGGVGLGLAICRAIVRLHQGRAWAERLAGGGIAFRFSLPVEEPPRPPVEPEAA